MKRFSMLSLAALGIALAAPAARAEDPATVNAKIKMETSLGVVVLELDGEKAPTSTLNFVRYTQDGFYNGTIFHRVMADFMIQGGGYLPSLEEKKQGLHEPIKNEWKNGLKNARGTIAMARLGRQPDSATAQFFINVVDNDMLDQARDGAAYAVFGKVVEGMDVVDKIRFTPVKNDPKLPMGQVVPIEPVVIKTVTVANNFDKAKCEANAKNFEAMAAKADAEAKAKEQGMNQERVKKYEEANAKGTSTPSGLKYFVAKEGTGKTPLPSDTVKVHYTGWFLDGNKFDSSVDRGQPATFPLSGVIKGWTEGVGLMKEGGKNILICPPDLAYGPQGRPGIPANSTLVFEVELLGIQ